MAEGEGEGEGLILGVENLMKNIGEMKAEYEKITNQILIARNLADGTDNVDNLRLIINDLSGWLGHIIEKDSTLFNNMCELLKGLRVIEKKREE